MVGSNKNCNSNTEARLQYYKTECQSTVNAFESGKTGWNMTGGARWRMQYK